MNSTQLRAFHLVAQAGGFSHGARAGRVSQPTLSAHVAALEQSYGVRLFERRGRSVQLTDLGRNLYDLTQRLFSLQDETEALLSGTKALARGHLRVFADNAYHVMPILAGLKRAYGGLTFSLSIGNSADVLRALYDYQCDIGVTAKMTSDPRLYSFLLKTDRLVLFAPLDHKLAGRRQIKLADLEGADIVMRERGSITREVFEAELARAGVTPGAIIDVQTREGVREAVAEGFGIGVVFESEFGSDARFRALPVVGANLAVAQYVVCVAERRRLALVAAFLEAAERLRAG